MALATTFSFPAKWLPALLMEYDHERDDQLVMKQKIKGIIEDAVLAGIEPVEVETDEQAIQINISFSEQAGSVIRAKSKEMGVTAGPFCRYVLAGKMKMGRTAEDIDLKRCGVMGEIVEALPKLEIRAPQVEFFKQVQDALAGSGIGICEASTGTGKTLGIMAAAIETLRSRKSEGRLVIGTPSIALITQFSDVWKKLDAVMDIPPLRVVLGRSEFVSKNELDNFLKLDESGIDQQPIKGWIARGGRSQAFDGDVTSWLASSLVSVSPDFPVNEVILPQIVLRDDPGYLAYQAQFYDDRNRTEIMLSTHAMLAIDLRRRIGFGKDDEDVMSINDALARSFSKLRKAKEGEYQIDPEEKQKDLKRLDALQDEKAARIADLSRENGILPPYHHVILDEAHLFESNVSSALSDYVSIKALMRHLKEYREEGGNCSRDAISKIDKAVHRIMDASAELQLDMLSLLEGSPVARDCETALREIAFWLETVKYPQPSASAKASALFQTLKSDLAVIKYASRKDHRSLAFLKLSPVRSYPQLFVGRKSVDHFLKMLWYSVDSAAAVSATLYLKKGDEYSASYQQKILAIPADRMKTYPPVIPSWLMKPIKGVWLPEAVTDEDGKIWLRPPSRMDKLDAADRETADLVWSAEVVAVIEKIYASAAGGVMVAMTSYDLISTFAEFMLPVFGDRLVVASPSLKLALQVDRFLQLSACGMRPIWLAIGAAWTGLDIGGHQPYAKVTGYELPPEEDNVMTDIIIPKLPFGTNRTITHAYRLEKQPGVPWEILETSFRIKQVMGRLVRRAGLPANRRIYILDGRMSDPKFGGMFGTIKNLIKPYGVRTLEK